MLQRLTGVKLARLLHDYANGIDHSPVLAEPEAVKGYGNTTTLEQDVTSTEQANKILLALCDSVASRMRADARRCSCVMVTIRSNDFRNRSHQRRLPEPTDVTAELYALARKLFAELWEKGPRAEARSDRGRPAQQIRRHRHHPRQHESGHPARRPEI